MGWVSGSRRGDDESVMVVSSSRRRWSLALLVVTNTSGLGLEIADLAEVEANSPGGEGVVSRGGVVVEGSAEAADEGVEAAPCLA